MTIQKTASKLEESELDRLVPPGEARAIVLQHAHPLPIERIPLADASWRVLAENVIATEDHPPFAASTMDGYAVVAEDGSPWREVIGKQTAGFVLDVEVTPGTAVQIMTGAPVPPGANAVVRIENTQPSEDHVIINQDHVSTGENIRPIGFDLKKGDPILPAGT